GPAPRRPARAVAGLERPQRRGPRGAAAPRAQQRAAARGRGGGRGTGGRGRRPVGRASGGRAAVRRAALLSSAAALVLAACSSRSVQVPKGAPLVLISIDTLRADHLAVYGYKGGSTPQLDALAREGVVFEDLYSHCPLTLPSHASMLTGLLPPHHGVRDNIGFTLKPER